MSERFIKALFTKLKPKDFNHTVFLQSLYKAAAKERIDPYDKYIEYLARNKTSDILHDTYISALLDDLYRNIILDQSESAFKKKHALDVLSEALESSSVTVDHDPRGENDNPFVEQFDTQTHTSLLSAVAAEQQGGRIIPAARPDAAFATRSERLKFYTANQIDILEMKPSIHPLPGTEAAQEEKRRIIEVLSKAYFIDSQVMADYWNKAPSQRIKLLDTVELKNDDPKPKVVLPSLHFTADYGPVVKTVFTMSSDTPLNEAVTLLSKKKRVLYICAGSASCCGGPVQNQECAEMPLYFRTTYPLAIETITQAYPLDAGRCVICPNVLVIKDANYAAAPHDKYKRVGVMMAPAPFRPKTNLPKNLSHEMDERLFAADTVYADHQTYAHLLHGYLEAALFFGYTNIILDDRGCRENWLPVLATARMINEAVRHFNNRFESIMLCIPDMQVRDIMKQAWGLK